MLDYESPDVIAIQFEKFRYLSIWGSMWIHILQFREGLDAMWDAHCLVVRDLLRVKLGIIDEGEFRWLEGKS